MNPVSTKEVLTIAERAIKLERGVFHDLVIVLFWLDKLEQVFLFLEFEYLVNCLLKEEIKQIEEWEDSCTQGDNYGSSSKFVSQIKSISERSLELNVGTFCEISDFLAKSPTSESIRLDSETELIAKTL